MKARQRNYCTKLKRRKIKKNTELISTGGLIKARQRKYCTNSGSNAEKFHRKRFTLKT